MSFLPIADGEAFIMDKNQSATSALLAELCDKTINLIDCLAYQSSKDCISLLAKLYNQGTLHINRRTTVNSCANHYILFVLLL